MSGFKLLAIRTGKKPDPNLIKKDQAKNFLKVLNPNSLYKFYNEYEFLDENEKEVEPSSKTQICSIRFKPSVPQDLYQQKWNGDEQNEKKLNINIYTLARILRVTKPTASGSAPTKCRHTIAQLQDASEDCIFFNPLKFYFVFSLAKIRLILDLCTSLKRHNYTNDIHNRNSHYLLLSAYFVNEKRKKQC